MFKLPDYEAMKQQNPDEMVFLKPDFFIGEDEKFDPFNVWDKVLYRDENTNEYGETVYEIQQIYLMQNEFPVYTLMDADGNTVETTSDKLMHYRDM